VSAALLTLAVLFNQRDLARSAGFTLTEIPASLQQKVQIRAASWGGLATCSAVGRGTVSLCDLRDGEVRRVRTSSSGGRAPQAFLSPDGRRVAYTWFEDLEPHGLRVVESTGTGDREILRAGADPTSLVGWNRGGTKVLLSASSQNETCAEALDVDSGSRERLHCLPAGSLGGFSLSADERYLAYTQSPATGGEPADLWILDRRSGTHRELTTDAALDTDVSWTPDGRHVAFASNRLGTWGIFTIEVEQGAARGSPRLIRDLGRSRPSLLGFTRQGSLLLRMMTDLEDIVRTQPDYAAESLGIPSRAEPSALDESNRSPDWSPDGNRFAFIAGEWRGRARLVIARLSGGIERSWTFPGGRSTFRVLRWSPDGTTLAVSVGSGQPNGSTLELIDLEQGRRREILSAGRITDLRWAPDGQGIYYLSQNGIHHLDIGTGEIRLVYRPTPPWTLEGTSTFDLSRDGSALLLAVTSAGVRCAARIVDVQKRTQDIGPLPGPCRAVAWTHDEQAILAAVHTPDGIPVFMAGVQGSKPPIRLQSPQIQAVEISPSPDGRELLLGVGNPRPDVWTLSGFAAASSSAR
jgi:Tol biopolymer transport system component